MEIVRNHRFLKLKHTDMTAQEVESKCFSEVSDRVATASSKINGWNKFRQIYDIMVKKGFHKEMQNFRDLVLYTAMINPTWTEDQVLADIYRELEKVPMA